MAVSSKLIAVIAVIVVVAAACAVVVMNGDDGDEKESKTSGITLSIYGNADGNRVLDKADVDYINDVISKNGTVEDYPFSDANNDGVIDSKDVEFVQGLIDNKSGTVFVSCLDTNGDAATISVDYPLKNVVTFGTNMNANILYFGGQDSVAGYNSLGYPNFEKALANVPGITDLSGSNMAFNLAKFTELDGSLNDKTGSGVGALLVDASKAKNLDDATLAALNASKVPILVFSVVEMDEEISTALTLGFLFGQETEKKALEYANGCAPVVEKIRNVIAGLSDEEKKTVVGVIMGYMLMAATSENYLNIEEAGGVPLFKQDAEFNKIVDVGKSVKLTTTENVLVNYDDKIDAMISIRSIDTNIDDLNSSIVTTWEKYQTYFEDLDCYESFVYVNNLLPGAVKIAYMIENLYPEKVGTGFGDDAFKSVSKVCFYLNGCTIENTFTDASYADYTAAKKALEGGDEPDAPSTDVKTATAKAIADAFVAANGSTTFTADAKTIAESFIAAIAGMDNVGTWTLADGATSDSAKIVESYVSSRGESTKTLTILRSTDAAKAYAQVVADIATRTSYTTIDVSDIDGVKVTACYNEMGSSTLLRFALSCGSIVIDGSTGDYAYLTNQDSGATAKSFLKVLASSVVADSKTVSWSIGEGATESSASIIESYVSSRGESTKEIKVIRGQGATEAEYKKLVDGNIASSYISIDLTIDNENVKCTAATRAMGDASLIRFVILYGDVLIDGCTDYAYGYGNSTADASSLVQAFIDAVTIEA